MFSIYTSAFNVEKNRFNWRDALASFSKFAEEVVIAVNTSEDDSLKLIQEFSQGKNIVVVPTDFSYESPDLDGAIKNAALQKTTQPFKIGLDLDERILFRQREIWERYADTLWNLPSAGSLMLPVINLCGDEQHYKDISQKWYLHKTGLFRGVVDFARNPDGTHDITKSDSCELINDKGQLVRTMALLPMDLANEDKLKILATDQIPYVIHYGFINFENKILRNKNFWKKHWEIEAGKEVDTVPLEEAELQKIPSFAHTLNLND